MGIAVKEIKSGKDKGRFVLTSSVSDCSSDPMSRAEALLHLHRRRLCDMQQAFIEAWFSFPNGWGDGHCRMIGSNQEGRDQWMAWWQEALRASKSDDEYYGRMQAKYDECMAQIKAEAGKDA